MNNLTLSPPIKFIAWDKHDKRLITWQELLDYRSGLTEYLADPRELILLQFTGHHDDNGNEVYAGHIVTAGDNYPSVIQWRNYAWVLREYYPRHGRYADQLLATSP